MKVTFRQYNYNYFEFIEFKNSETFVDQYIANEKFLAVLKQLLLGLGFCLKDYIKHNRVKNRKQITYLNDISLSSCPN